MAHGQLLPPVPPFPGIIGFNDERYLCSRHGYGDCMCVCVCAPTNDGLVGTSRL